MAAYQTFRHLVEKIIYYIAAAGMIFVIPLMLLTTGDVVGRSFLDKPIAGTFELSEYMLAVIILLSAAYTQQVKGHVAVDFLTARFSPKVQRYLQVLTTGLSLAIVSIVVWQGIVLGLEEKAVTDQLRIPKAPFKMLVGICGALLWLQLFFDLVDAVKARKGEASWTR
ncbi:MAG: TRAP transporter small permease [Deltaproteobacteria bacterium]|nr:TRAP transporter small permease [Deltaproteobacteria bacterium]